MVWCREFFFMSFFYEFLSSHLSRRCEHGWGLSKRREKVTETKREPPFALPLPPPPSFSFKKTANLLSHPVVRRHPGLDPGLEQGVDHLVVEGDALGVDRRRGRAPGHDAGPRDRHAELVDAHLLHQGDVLGVLVVEVVRDVAGVLGERVPDRDAAPALARAALDLVGGGRDAPGEGRRGGDAAVGAGAEGGGVLGLLEEAAAEGAGAG